MSTKTKPHFKCKKTSPRKQPLWRGPDIDGVTQSMLGRFLCCRERFRLLVVEGLRPREDFNHRLEYGNMWHLCEEHFANGQPWEDALKTYSRGLCKKYPLQVEQVEKWYNVCKTQFPIYVDWWKKHSDVTNRTPLLQEQVFSVPYTLPSGRAVKLRGKWDSVDIIGKGKRAGIYLQENKTKGDVDEQKIAQQLSFDLQTMFYLIALEEARNQPDEAYVGDEWQTPIRGVRYNVVRRPLSGGLHTISQGKPTKKNPSGESSADFYQRLADRIKGDPEFFFLRFRVEITQHDVDRFKHRCLNPILEQLCDWWECVGKAELLEEDPFDNSAHYQFPYGITNPMTERYGSDLDNYVNTGSEIGLTRTKNLYPELEE